MPTFFYYFSFYAIILLVGDRVNLEVIVNDYLLAWYILYGASLSKEIDRFKKNLFTKYKKEYNFCYKDRMEILKYGKDFIPDNDILYNAVLTSSLFKTLKKETIKHRNNIEKVWESSRETINTHINNIIRLPFPKIVHVYVIHPRFEITEYVKDLKCIVWGSEKDKYDVLTIFLSLITKGLLIESDDNFTNNKEILNSIVELSVVNEIGKSLSKSFNYDLGNPVLKIIKRQIYPYWLMYLGYVDKEKLLNKMIDDKIGFDLEKYPIDRSLKKMNLKVFTEYCIKNSRNILKLNNIIKIEKKEDVEVI
jgi:hypothetical protein